VKNIFSHDLVPLASSSGGTWYQVATGSWMAYMVHIIRSEKQDGSSDIKCLCLGFRVIIEESWLGRISDSRSLCFINRRGTIKEIGSMINEN